MKTIPEKQSPGSIKQTVTPVVTGILAAFIMSILLLCIFSLLMTLRDMPAGANVPFACVSIAGGALTGGFVTERIYGNKGLLFGAVQGVSFFLVLYLAGALMRQADLNVAVLLKLLLSMAFGSIGGIAGVNSRRRRARA